MINIKIIEERSVWLADERNPAIIPTFFSMVVSNIDHRHWWLVAIMDGITVE